MTTPPPIAEVMLAEAQAITAAAQRLDATHAQRAVDMLVARCWLPVWANPDSLPKRLPPASPQWA
jgi:hypothetical protein